MEAASGDQVGLEIQFDARANVVRMRGHGTVTRDDIEHALRRLRRLALRPGHREIVDLRAVRSFDVAAPYLRRVAAHLGEVMGPAATDARLAASIDDQIASPAPLQQEPTNATRQR